MSHQYVSSRSRKPGIQRNADYRLIGSSYEHVVMWSKHHGVKLDPKVWIVHHINEVKNDNYTCNGPEPCPDWACGNLGALTRSDHIRLHKPGRMGGRKIPNKAGKKQYTCENCRQAMSKHGNVCRPCYLSLYKTSPDPDV